MRAKKLLVSIVISVFAILLLIYILLFIPKVSTLTKNPIAYDFTNFPHLKHWLSTAINKTHRNGPFLIIFYEHILPDCNGDNPLQWLSDNCPNNITPILALNSTHKSHDLQNIRSNLNINIFSIIVTTEISTMWRSLADQHEIFFLNDIIIAVSEDGDIISTTWLSSSSDRTAKLHSFITKVFGSDI